MNEEDNLKYQVFEKYKNLLFEMEKNWKIFVPILSKNVTNYPFGKYYYEFHVFEDKSHLYDYKIRGNKDLNVTIYFDKKNNIFDYYKYGI